MLIAGGPSDFLLSNEVPSSLMNLMDGAFDLAPEIEVQAQVSGELINNAVNVLQPRRMFCGRWH